MFRSICFWCCVFITSLVWHTFQDHAWVSHVSWILRIQPPNTKNAGDEEIVSCELVEDFGTSWVLGQEWEGLCRLCHHPRIAAGAFSRAYYWFTLATQRFSSTVLCMRIVWIAGGSGSRSTWQEVPQRCRFAGRLARLDYLLFHSQLIPRIAGSERCFHADWISQKMFATEVFSTYNSNCEKLGVW